MSRYPVGMSVPEQSSSFRPEQRLVELGITLPTAPKPVAAYIPTRRSGAHLYVSGQIPIAGGQVTITGSVPSQVSIEQAKDAARLCTLNGLAAARAELGSLDRITRVVRVGCFVASDFGFGDQPKIANGCSELLVEIFGEAGRHARAAVGASALPLNVPVEIEFLFEVAG